MEKIERFKTLSKIFIEKIYTKKEIDYANRLSSPEEVFCSRWCAKEAVIKAFSNKKLNFKEIEVNNADDGKPYIVKNETIKKELQKHGFSDIKISISHTKDYSTAICIIY